MTSEKLDQARMQIQDALAASQNPIACWSAGADSMLLLYLLREQKPDIPCLSFMHFWGDVEFAKRIIKEWDLTCFSYRPSKLEFKDNSIVAYYFIKGQFVPVITDVLPGERCGLDLGREVLTSRPIPAFLWDSVFVGSRKSDTHALVPTLDMTGFATPLWDWTDDEVLATASDLQIPIDHRVYKDNNESARTDNISLCMNCMGTCEQVYCPKIRGLIAGLGVN